MRSIGDFLHWLFDNARSHLNTAYDDPPFTTFYLWLRVATLVVLLVAIALKIRSMVYHTRFWDGLGRALRAENITYAIMWLWFLIAPSVPAVRHPLVLVGLEVALIVVTLRVVVELPRAPLVGRGDDRLGDPE